MKRTLELSPELENRLQVLAAQSGTSVEAVAVQVIVLGLHEMAEEVTEESQPVTNQNPLSPRQRAALEGFGKYAGGNFGSADLVRERRQEAAHEMRQADAHENALRKNQRAAA